MITPEYLEQIRQSLEDENISYSELSDLDVTAEELGIEVTDQMTATDIYIAIEEKLR